MGQNSYEFCDGKSKGSRIVSQRFLLSYLLFCGTFCLYILRTNMSVAIVCMTNDGPAENNTQQLNSTTSPPQEDCPKYGDDEAGSSLQGEFDWDRSLRGLILSSFYIGYLITQFPAGLLSKKVGCKRLILIGMVTLCIANLLTPISAHTSIYLLIAIQIIKGGASGLYYPSINQLWGFWATTSDRSILFAISYSGASIGSVLSSIFSGILCEHGFGGGWPSIFYIYGLIGAFWCLAWFFLGYETPADHPRITAEERECIEKSLGNKEKEENKLSVPWSQLLRSAPFFAMLVANFVYSWGWYTALNVLPQYLKDVLKFNIAANGFFNSLPYLCNFVVSISGSILADTLLSRGWLSRANTRKVLTTLGTLPPAILAILAGFMNCHQVPLAITCLSFWVGFMGFSRSGSLVNAIDLAPAYAGVMNGFDQSLNTVPGIIAPTITGIMTPDGAVLQWRNVFFLGAGLLLIGWIFYMIFADGEEQGWAKMSNKNLHKETGVNTTISTDKGFPISVIKQSTGHTNEAFELGSMRF